MANPSIIFGAVVAASMCSVPAVGHAASDPDPIVVTGERQRAAEMAADQAAIITIPPRVDTPLARHYAPLCVRTFAIDPAYGELVAERLTQNAGRLGLPVGKRGCTPNIWIGFVRDSAAELRKQRSTDPTLFAQLKSFEADRVFQGSSAAQILHVTEIRSSDGRPIPIVTFNLSGKNSRGDNKTLEGKYNSQYQAGRLSSTIRNDINGTLLIFDRLQADGRTVRQLADYATMRILAPVKDFKTSEPDQLPSILHLFAEGAERPVGLTAFDWAYLTAYYKLDRGARATALHDAVHRATLDGHGQTRMAEAE